MFLFLALIACSNSACRPASSPVKDQVQPQGSATCGAMFKDRALEALSQAGFSNGKEAELYSILEIVGGGVACLDYDLDGAVDLFVPRGGVIDPAKRQVSGVNSLILQSVGAWELRDRTESSRIATAAIYSHGMSPADFDHDGFDDLLVYGYGGIVLLHNQGDGTFADITQLIRPLQSNWTTAAAWIDLDGDRSLDLYLGSYVLWDFDHQQSCSSPNGEPDVCSPTAFNGTRITVLLNNRDGSFSHKDGLLEAPIPAKTLGVVAGEFTPGQGCGLYVANDLIANFLFTRRNGQFQEHALSSGVAADDEGVNNGSMGLAVLDYNLDQRFDLFVTNFEHEKMALYANEGQDVFHHVSRQAGLNRSDLQVVGFGAVAGDFDGDADEDIVFTAGHVHYHPNSGSMEQLPAYLQNQSGREFVKCTPKSRFFEQPAVGRGLATADFDRDGDLDLIATSLFSPPTVVENVSPPRGNWLALTLVGIQSPRTPVGTTVALNTGERTLVRQLFSGGSYLSHSESTLTFAWPKRAASGAAISLTVRWPDGAAAQSLEVAPNQRLTVVQGKGAL